MILDKHKPQKEQIFVLKKIDLWYAVYSKYPPKRS